MCQSNISILLLLSDDRFTSLQICSYHCESEIHIRQCKYGTLIKMTMLITTQQEIVLYFGHIDFAPASPV